MSAIAEPVLRRELRSLLTAVQYFTRVPVPRWVGHSTEQLAHSVRYFPLVGLGVGAGGALVLWLCAQVLPALLAVILSCAVTLLLTGAFHEDGLADTFDGLGGAATRERAMEIMKDSRLGTFGTLALLVAVLLKIAALSTLSTPDAALALIAGHGLSRACAVLMAWCLPYVRDDAAARAKPMVESLRDIDLAVAAGFGVLPLFAIGRGAAGGLLLALLVVAVLYRWFKQRLGGYTGDTLGATQQGCEIAFYLALAAWTSN